MVIVGVVMLLMGPDKLPEVAHKLGATWRAIKNLQEKVEAEVREAIPDLPSTGDIARIARSPVNLLNQLADRVDAKEAAANQSAASEGEFAGDESPPLLTSPRPPTPPPKRTDDPSPPPDPSLN
jgi:Sec-independent protein translocase protein TatA